MTRRISTSLVLLMVCACGGTELKSEPCLTTRAIPERVTLAPGAGRTLGFFEDGVGWHDPETFVLSEGESDFVYAHGRLIAHVAAPERQVSLTAPAGCEVQLSVTVESSSPFASELIEFTPGTGAGFGQSQLPDVVMGPPDGGGMYSGSTDVVSLGLGGRIGLGFGELSVFDGAGPDFIVFENAFFALGSTAFSEPARIEVGDGQTRAAFDCAERAGGYAGCAGLAPVFASPSHPDIDPTDLARAGGDAFDLSGVLERADEVWVADVGTSTAAGGTAGFDLDAIAVVNWLFSDTSALTTEFSRVEMAVGEILPLPRIDAHRSSGEVQYAVSARIEVEGDSVVVRDDALVAVSSGATEIIFSAGEFSTRLRVEVKDETQ